MVVKSLIQSADDSGELQVLKISMLKDEVKDEITRVQEYGFTSRPPKGAEAIVLCVNGNRENSIVIATDSSKFRPKDLAEGDSVMYNKNGVTIRLDGDDINIACDGKVNITCNQLDVNSGNLTVD